MYWYTVQYMQCSVYNEALSCKTLGALQWLSAQKMEGLLCCWSLAIQEYDFTIVHRKGSLNTVADSLSRCVPVEALSAATQLHTDHEKEDVYNAQRSRSSDQSISGSAATFFSETHTSYYHSVPVKRPLPSKHPDACFGCTNGERPLPGKRLG